MSDNPPCKVALGPFQLVERVDTDSGQNRVTRLAA
jgi:hypothetical protein